MTMKEDGDDDDFDDDYDEEGEDFTHYEYHDDLEDEDDAQSHNGARRSSSRSVSPEMRAPRVKFNAKAHKRSALTQLLASVEPQQIIKPSVQSSPAASAHPRRSELSKSLMKELEAAVNNPASASPSTKYSSSAETIKSRRKSANPVPRSVAVDASSEHTALLAANAEPLAITHEQSPLRHWLGFGAADEGIPTGGAARKPWSIQNWLLSGFRRKQTSECLANDD